MAAVIFKASRPRLEPPPPTDVRATHRQVLSDHLGQDRLCLDERGHPESCVHSTFTTQQDRQWSNADMRSNASSSEIRKLLSDFGIR